MMKHSYIASFDIGTTAIKGLLINEEAETFAESSFTLHTIHNDKGHVEQDPEDWWEGVVSITHHWREAYSILPKDIKAITFSGQMEDVIPVAINIDEQPNAILYSDQRAKKEADYILNVMPDIAAYTANGIAPSTPLAKLLWLKENQSELFSSIKTFLFSAKDYVIYKLTGALVSDPVTCATTGMMNITKKKWDPNIINRFDIDDSHLPTLLYSDEVAGHVSEEAMRCTGFTKGIPVLCGAGDAGATTLGASAIREGDSYIYLGTTGWTAVPLKEPAWKKDGIFNLSHLPRDLFISISPLLNVGNVHQWAVDNFIGAEEKNKYDKFDQLLEESPAGSGGVICLPYFQGERSHIQDPDAKGAFWGIHPNTSKSELARAVIEGLSFSLRQNLEELIPESKGTITLIGGGTKSSMWCQCLADILGQSVKVPEESEYLPAIGAASSAFILLGWSVSYEAFVDCYLEHMESKDYSPNEEHQETYERMFSQFKRLYSSLKSVYNS